MSDGASVLPFPTLALDGSIAAKCRGACRICGIRTGNRPHALIPRDQSGELHGDNIVGLCSPCRDGVELREPRHCRLMLVRLTAAEYAYALDVGGAGVLERLYGVDFDHADGARDDAA